MTIFQTRSFAQNPGRLIGLIYLSMAVFGAFGILYPLSLIAEGDAAATVENMRASGALFHLSIVSGLVGQTIFIVLAVSLYRLLVTVNRGSALLMLAFALVGIAIEMMNAVNYFAVKILLSEASDMSSVDTEYLHSQLTLFLDMQRFGTLVAQIFWGLWLLPLGYLVYRSTFFPGFLGVFLMVACLGYLTNSTVGLTFVDYESAALATVEGVAGITTLGEILFAFWLLIMGVNVEQWNKHRKAVTDAADRSAA